MQRVATGTYWAGGAYFDPPWKGAVLFSSDDGAVYASVDETFAAVSWGAAINALPDTDTPFQTDTSSALRVAMVSGALASVTALDMLNGANRAALIGADGVAEIIQFQDAVLEDGVYTLTNLLRGRRGTEVFTGGHAAGDLFVLLDSVSRRGLPLSRIGATLHHRLVGRGGELRDAATNRATLVGRDLMPYAPAHLTLAGEVGVGHRRDLGAAHAGGWRVARRHGRCAAIRGRGAVRAGRVRRRRHRAAHGDRSVLAGLHLHRRDAGRGFPERWAGPHRGLADQHSSGARLCGQRRSGVRTMSNNLNLSQVAAAQNQKEVTINDQAGQLDAALTEGLVVLVDDGNAVTLTAEQFRRAFFFVLTPDETPAPTTPSRSRSRPCSAACSRSAT